MLAEPDDAGISELTAPVGMEDGADAVELAGKCRVTQRLDDDLCAHVVGHRPAEHPAGVLVSDGTQVGLTGADGHVGDVARPHKIQAPWSNWRLTRSGGYVACGPVWS